MLQTAKEKGVTSIAIPSLGVGNLNYPASVSARILFDQVIAFHAQFPKATIQKFHFVIYEKKVYEEFSKEYAQRMSDGTQVIKYMYHLGERGVRPLCFFKHITISKMSETHHQ